MGDTMGDVHGGGRVSGEGAPHSGEAGLLDPPIQPPDSSSSTVLVVPPSLQCDYLWSSTIFGVQLSLDLNNCCRTIVAGTRPLFEQNLIVGQSCLPQLGNADW